MTIAFIIFLPCYVFFDCGLYNLAIWLIQGFQKVEDFFVCVLVDVHDQVLCVLGFPTAFGFAVKIYLLFFGQLLFLFRKINLLSRPRTTFSHRTRHKNGAVSADPCMCLYYYLREYPHSYLFS